MSVFVVIADEKKEKLGSLLEQHYPDNYYHDSEQVFFVRTGHIADKIAKNLEIKTKEGENLVNGVVLKLTSSFAGYTSRGFWDWLEKDDE